MTAPTDPPTTSAETVHRIRALAEHGATEAERETARGILDRLRARGVDVDAPAPEELGEVIVRTKTDAEELLCGHAGAYLGLRAFYVLDRRGRRQARATRFRGPASMCALLPGLIAHHRERLARVTLYAGLGYLLGAMPSPPSTGSSSDATVSEADLAVIRAGLAAGRAVPAPLPALGAGPRRR